MWQVAEKIESYLKAVFEPKVAFGGSLSRVSLQRALFLYGAGGPNRTDMVINPRH
jgi:hypothetical protein